MPESMFGRPLQHLLPSRPQTSAGGSSEASNPPTAPVPLAPLPFKDFRFNSIGKQPELLSRISLPQPDSADYHSPTPSPLSIPPPASISDFPKTTSRPTLFQQLAGSDSSWNALTSRPDGSLASRIQMSGSPSNSVADTAHGTASRLPSPPSRIDTVRRTTEGANLIPPVEVLPQPPGSSPTTPTSWVPPLDQGDVHSPALSTPLINTTAITTSQVPTPSVAIMNIASRELTEPPSPVVDATTRDLQPSLSAASTIDSLLARQERLQSISAKLANLASPLPPLSSQSPSPDLSSVTWANIDIIPEQRNQLQPGLTPVVLHHPYPASRSAGQVQLCADDAQSHANASPVILPSPTTVTQEYRAQSEAIVAAIQNLNSVLSAAQRAQLDCENALALRTRALEEQRAAFEQTKRVEEATLQREFQELQKKREELNAKEALLASLEKENKAREEAKRGILAKRQAQEEEKRAAEAKRVQGVQEQIASAMNELKEFEALKAKWHVFQLASETLADDLPTEPREGRDEEETAVIKSRNDLLCAVKHLRRMHADKVQKLEETNRTLLRLGEERKKREGEEAERRRIAEERSHALVEAERAHQLLDEKRRQVEAQIKYQEVEKGHEQAQILVEQQAHAKTQANASGPIHATNGQTFEYPTRLDQVGASQSQGITDASRIRVAHKEKSFPPETVDAMNVDEDGRIALKRTVVSSDINTNPCAPQSKQKKNGEPVSGGVMLTAPTSKGSGGHLPPRPLAISPSLSSPVHMDAPKTPKISPAVSVALDGGRNASLPVQLASGPIRAVNAECRSTPDHKPAFSRTPKSQTILEATGGASQELNINIGPLAGVSPTQQNVNLRHLKRFRGRVEGNDSGDRSVRTISVKSEESSHISVKKEAHEVVPASLSTNPPPSLPPRPAIIPPPRPRMLRKRSEAPAAQTDPSSLYPPKGNESLKTRGEAEVTINEQPKEVIPRATLSSQSMHPPVQRPAPSETSNSLLLGPAYTESQAQESRINASERPTRNRGEDGDTSPSELASATLSRELDGEDPSRNNRRFTDEHRKGPRRMSDHYSPPSVTSRPLVTSPTQSHRPVDSWRPQNSSNGPRAEPMRVTSPITGRKRPSEYTDNEYGHRARRQRGDVWVAQDHDRDRVDPYRLHRDRRLDSGAAYHGPGSPTDRSRPYPLDMSRTTYDSRTYTSEEPTSPVARWEQSYRRTEGDDAYHQYQPSAPVYNATADQHYTDDARLGQAYEPKTEESMDTQPELLARIHDTQRFPPRGRGRGEPSRGRGDSGRGRGRGVARGGTPLLDRLTSGPSSSSLENRLT